MPPRSAPSIAVVWALAACALGALVGCGAGGSPSSGNPPTRSVIRPTPSASLKITYRPGTGGYIPGGLVCAERDRTDGFLAMRNASELCRELVEVGRFLLSPPPRDRVCTEIYGGPETATIEGTIDGHRVRRRFARRDGCQIADWDHAGSLLPRPIPR